MKVTEVFTGSYPPVLNSAEEELWEVILFENTDFGIWFDRRSYGSKFIPHLPVHIHRDVKTPFYVNELDSCCKCGIRCPEKLMEYIRKAHELIYAGRT